ncbi:BON domain-containing protein [uncultured Massilia sp.]|uniref:BON domain-containing protein n=1 Tax=uncultured Massilia sp. TaxID=169973 RepID=UPI0025EC6AC1|nr:BON domain-containing protein [uncultured Massilia sp.]
MKTLIATLLATAAGASFAQAPTAALNHDAAAYRNITQKATADYQAATAKCDAMSGNDKDICMAEAKVVRVRAENAALAQYSTSPASRQKARTNLADAEYALAKQKCDARDGADKDSCMDNAKSVHTAAIADAKSDRSAATGASGAGTTTAGGLVSNTDTREPAKAAAVDKCAQMGADARTGCLVETKPSPLRENTAAAAARTGDAAQSATEAAADKTRAAAATAAEKTKAVAATAVEKTREVAQAVADKTKQVASSATQKTENALDRAGDNTRDATASAAQKSDKAMDRAGEGTRDAAARTRVAAADTAITTKVKAGLVKEPDLKSLGIHVETEQGVVMLSGFVNSKTEADKAVKVARGVDGVTKVESAIKVK